MHLCVLSIYFYNPTCPKMMFINLRENLQRLLEDKSFKEEIVHFSISEETTVVKTEHRPDLIPVLMRCVLKCEFKSFMGEYHEQEDVMPLLILNS